MHLSLSAWKHAGKFRLAGPLDVYADSVSDSEERVFFGQLQLADGTFRTTESHRLDDLNQVLVELLPRDRPLEVMDVAVSSGITAVELSDYLRSAGIEHRLTAGDAVLEARMLSLGETGAVLWQTDGYPLVLQLADYSIYLHRNAAIRTLLLRLPLKLLYLVASRLPDAGFDAPPAPRRVLMRSVGLTSRRLREHPWVRVVLDDIRRPSSSQESLDVCRAANILNRSYFSEPELECMAGALLARVREGGLFVVCRTCGEGPARVNQASIFQKVRGRPQVAARLNGGSEVESVVLAGGGHRTRGAIAIPQTRSAGADSDVPHPEVRAPRPA